MPTLWMAKLCVPHVRTSKYDEINLFHFSRRVISESWFVMMCFRAGKATAAGFKYTPTTTRYARPDNQPRRLASERDHTIASHASSSYKCVKPKQDEDELDVDTIQELLAKSKIAREMWPDSSRADERQAKWRPKIKCRERNYGLCSMAKKKIRKKRFKKISKKAK